MNYSLPFLWHCLTKYYLLSIEAVSEEGREYARVEYLRFKNIEKQYQQ